MTDDRLFTIICNLDCVSLTGWKRIVSYIARKERTDVISLLSVALLHAASAPPRSAETGPLCSRGSRPAAARAGGSMPMCPKDWLPPEQPQHVRDHRPPRRRAEQGDWGHGGGPEREERGGRHDAGL